MSQRKTERDSETKRNREQSRTERDLERETLREI